MHDAARPCLSLDALSALIAEARSLNEGVILASPVADTLKQVNDDGAVTATIDRRIMAAQRAQLFPLFSLKCLGSLPGGAGGGHRRSDGDGMGWRAGACSGGSNEQHQGDG